MGDLNTPGTFGGISTKWRTAQRPHPSAAPQDGAGRVAADGLCWLGEAWMTEGHGPAQHSFIKSCLDRGPRLNQLQ